jgi:DNA topoisomerase-1
VAAFVKLIITEKDDAAQKIGQILGGHVTVKEHGGGRQKVKSYAFDYDGEPAVAIGLRGHVMETVFPNTYKRWSLKTLGDMIRQPDLAWIVGSASVGTVAALRTVAKGADAVIIATDFDREGELIGHEALHILRGDALKRHPDDKPGVVKRGRAKKGAAAPPAAPAPADDGELHVKPILPSKVVDRHFRVRYSALIADEVKAAFAKPSSLDFGLAEAAHSRQDIDLIWGAVLTRFISLASYRYGSEFLSVGRVQTPTLRLVVDRELERRAFVPVPYWEIKALLERGGEQLEVAHTKGRFETAEAAQAALANAQAKVAVVTGYKTQPRNVAPPVPFNTTALMSAAAAVGVSPSRAMRAAESLYLDGLISYPRTDNTVYPNGLDIRATLQTLTAHAPVAQVAAELAGQDTFKPTRGKKHTTDHPPVYPVGTPKSALSGDRERVYDLVVRRFLATLMPAAVVEGQRLDVRIGSEPFLARGSRVADPGFLRVYQKYSSNRDKALPPVHEGDEFAVLDLRNESKETQPPSRFSQSTLIEQMEELGLGTKATRADMIQHLYDRNYVRDNPLEPTEIGIALIAAFDAALHDAPMDISTAAMTARLERHMDAISEGSRTRAEVVAESQQMLEQAWRNLEDHVEQIRDSIKAGAKEDRGEGLILGVCQNCGGQLKVLRGRTGKRFVACVGKEGEEPPTGTDADGKPLRPGCGQTFPLPQRGVIMPTGTMCASCGWPEIKVTGAGNRGRPWTLCLDMDCPTKEKYRQRKQRQS